MIRSFSGGIPAEARPGSFIRSAFFAGAGLALAAALAGAYMLNRAPVTAAPAGFSREGVRSGEAFPVAIAIARHGTLTQHLTTSGTLRAIRAVEVQARVGGSLMCVAVSNGRTVRRGDTLALLDNREYRVAFERARAGLLNAQIEFRSLSSTPFLAASDSLETARRIVAESHSLDSLRTLYHMGRMDDAGFERLSREREAALAYLTASRGDVIAGRSGLAAAREAFETAQLDLEWTTIVAPFDGVVADCSLAQGMRIGAAQPLLTLLDLDTLLVDVEVLEKEIGSVDVGRSTRILPAAVPGHEFMGTVLSLNPLVDPKSRTLKATIALRDRHGTPAFLCPGMFATVQIETVTLPHRLLVPRQAVLVRDERQVIFTVERGSAKWHYVTIGASNDALTEITTGIHPGDTVIVDGHYTLAHDAPVAITRTGL